MTSAESLHPALLAHLVDGLYVEALVMADEARSYFDREGREAQTDVGSLTRLSWTCESLKVTTRLMHVIAWLMTHKAWQRGEISSDALDDTKYRLGSASASDPAVVATMQGPARELVEGSQLLYERVLRLQQRMRGERLRTSRADVFTSPAPDALGPGPARELLGRLERAF